MRFLRLSEGVEGQSRPPQDKDNKTKQQLFPYQVQNSVGAKRGLRNFQSLEQHANGCLSPARYDFLSVFYVEPGWLGSRLVSMLDSGAEGPGFKSQPRCCQVTVLGKLFYMQPLSSYKTIKSAEL